MDSKCSTSDVIYKTYRKRWLILLLFSLNSMLNASYWAQYTIIEDIIKKYYSVSNQAIEWTALSYIVIFAIFFLPGTFLINRLGLRCSTLLGAVFTVIGAWVKMASINPERFWVVLLSQFICGIGQVFILSVPPFLAALWFPSNEIATATAIGVFGNQIGICVSFLTSSMLVRDSENLDEIGNDLFNLFLYMGITQTIMLLLIFFFFKSQPPVPPSPAQNKQNESESFSDFIKSLTRLCKNRNFLIMLLAYGINTGSFYAVSILLGEIILTYFQDAHEFAGIVGVVIILAGTVGSIITGQVLDRTRKFKETTLIIYMFSAIGMFSFTFTVESQNETATYCIAAFLGFFMAGYLSVGLDFAAELTYPESESSSSGCMTAIGQTFTLLITLLYRAIIDSFSLRTANLFCSALLFFGMGISTLISSDLRRQKAIADANIKLQIAYTAVNVNPSVAK